jgi:hypothetical protein
MYLTIKFPSALTTVLGENLRASVGAMITKFAPTWFALRQSYTSKTMVRWLTRRYPSGNVLWGGRGGKWEKMERHYEFTSPVMAVTKISPATERTVQPSSEATHGASRRMNAAKWTSGNASHGTFHKLVKWPSRTLKFSIHLPFCRPNLRINAKIAKRRSMCPFPHQPGCCSLV